MLPEDLLTIKKMYDDGFHVTVIARKFNVNPSTVRFHLGLKPNHPSPRKDTPKKRLPKPYYQRPATKVKTGLTYLDIRKKQNFVAEYDLQGNLVRTIPKPPIKKINLWGNHE